MRTLLLFLTFLLFTTTNLRSKETQDCKNIKRNSAKYLICKSKSLGSTIKDKLSKKSNSDKKSFLKKFGEAKSLSDLAK